MNKQQRDQQDIWFRNPMVWFIFLLPLTVVVASILTIAIAYKHAPTIASNAAPIKPSNQPEKQRSDISVRMNGSRSKSMTELRRTKRQSSRQNIDLG